MRQALEPEQVLALPQDQQAYIVGWMAHHGYADALRPTVGHLAEFLIEHREPFRIEHTGITPGNITIWTGYNARHGWHERVPGNDLLVGLWADVRYWLERRRGQPGREDLSREVRPS